MSDYTVKIDNIGKIDTLYSSSDGASVMINRHGCEVIGYRITDRRRKENRELGLMYRDSEAGPPERGWKNHATILFPIVGGMKNDESKLGDTVVKSPGNHGVARNSEFELVETTLGDSSRVKYRLEADSYTRKYYPFDFSLDVTYELVGSSLSVLFELLNPGKETIHASWGWHPGFRTPLIAGNGTKQDCRLLFPDGNITRYHNNEHCRLTGETSEVKTDGPLEWTEEGLEATLMYAIDSPSMRRVTLEDPNAKVAIRVDFPDMPHLGFWSEPGDEFICIEPWQGMDDHEEQEPFDQKVGMVAIAPGEKKMSKVTVTPELL
ncbi:aldose 1-epimerase family protein [Gemmatimonadota bacterium]